jgi:hypothetical protein
MKKSTLSKAILSLGIVASLFAASQESFSAPAKATAHKNKITFKADKSVSPLCWQAQGKKELPELIYTRVPAKIITASKSPYTEIKPTHTTTDQLSYTDEVTTKEGFPAVIVLKGLYNYGTKAHTGTYAYTLEDGKTSCTGTFVGTRVTGN